MYKLLVIFLLYSAGLFAQDTILFVNGRVQEAKVLTIEENGVRYKRSDNPNGPDYIVSKSEIKLIRYANGMTDTIARPGSNFTSYSPQYSTLTVQAPLQEQQQQQNGDWLMATRSGKMYHNGKTLYPEQLYDLLDKYPDTAKRAYLIKTYEDHQQYKYKQYEFGYGGPIVAACIGVSSGYIYDRSLLPGKGYILAAGIITGLGVFVVSEVMSGQFKHKRRKALKNLVWTYNGDQAAPKFIPMQMKPSDPLLMPEKKLINKNGHLYYESRALGTHNFEKLLVTYPDDQKRELMLKDFREAQRYKRKSSLHGLLGVIAPIVMVSASSFVGSLYTAKEAPIEFGGIAAGLLLFIPNEIAHQRNKKKYVGKLDEIVKTYN